jgi:hypothetical protein
MQRGQKNGEELFPRFRSVTFIASLPLEQTNHHGSMKDRFLTAEGVSTYHA